MALDPPGIGGAVLRAPAGPVRDAWLSRLTALLGERPLLRMPAGIGDARLLGGLDLTATLASGRPVGERGLLAQADDGVVLAAMAERISPATAARIALAMDCGEIAVARDGLADICPSRFGLVALDEGISADERPPEALCDRLALRLDLGTLSHRDIEAPVFTPGDIAEACARLPDVAIDDAAIEALCMAALALGIGSARASLHGGQGGADDRGAHGTRRRRPGGRRARGRAGAGAPGDADAGDRGGGGSSAAA